MERARQSCTRSGSEVVYDNHSIARYTSHPHHTHDLAERFLRFDMDDEEDAKVVRGLEARNKPRFADRRRDNVQLSDLMTIKPVPLQTRDPMQTRSALPNRSGLRYT